MAQDTPLALIHLILMLLITKSLKLNIMMIRQIKLHLQKPKIKSMKKVIFLFLFSQLFFNGMKAQWTVIPSGTTARLEGLYFASATNGFATGGYNSYITTTKYKNCQRHCHYPRFLRRNQLKNIKWSNGINGQYWRR